MADRALSQAGRQLALAFPARAAFGADAFVPAPCNAEALAWLGRYPDWPQQVLVLAGGGGSGKTHLAHVFAERHAAQWLDAAALGPGPLATMTWSAPTVLDNADRVADPVDLLHLVNLVRQAGGSLLLTGRQAPALWYQRPPDLVSRLRAMPVAHLAMPDEDLIASVLLKHFADRQLVVPDAAIVHAARHLERSLDAARRLAARIDALALGEGGRVTQALVRRAVAELAEADPA
ncbi:HdaA/DnaA family protein [Zavarzinia sp. CC-PAN008]|uniref:HdaA/DnaA family protein n=1 Tax=Zavarzinia sp. CC-PAN008 TaxID=3243332 RepID=UPI003F746B40